jgi:hypothetical protein
MSDVAVAPQGDAGAAASEVVVNQDQTSLPNPIGSQAPDRPVGPDFKGSEHRPPSRRESIQAAFDRALNPPPKTDRPAPKAAPKAAEAKVGHNNPPEETPKIDLRKRPTEPVKQQAQPRGERGQFAPREQPQAQRQEVAPQPPAPRLPSNAPYAHPINRMSDRAKYDWHQAPESVRADVHRMHKEFTDASNYFKESHAIAQPLRPYHQLAQSQGTTLEKALYNYVSMEQKLRSDPVGGLDVIVNNLNLKTQDGQRIGLRDLAYHVLSQTPDQLRAIQQGNQQQAAAQQIGALSQQVTGLQNAIKQMHHQQQFTQTRGSVDQFAASHPRFDELGDLIEQELRLGFDLNTAYRRAELLRPGTAAQTRTTSAQTRPVNKSISGGPASTNGAVRHREPSKSARDAVQNAINRVNGRL